MKKLLLLLIFIPAISSAQIALHITGGLSTSNNFNGFVGAELQGSNVSVLTAWRPVKIENPVYINGFSLSGRIYLWAYQTTPFFSIGIISHGKYQIDEVTGKAIRSMPITIGARIYPSQYNDNILDRLSFDVSMGVEICKYETKPYVEITGNFTLFK